MLPFSRIEPTAHRGPIAIGPADVHVWAFKLDESEATVDMWARLLADDEMLRANRFVRRRDRDRWIVAHGVLRQLLSRYCGNASSAMAFEHGPAGKPSIARGGAYGEPISFNLAHSHDRALLGVARSREIGVDLERIREDFDPLPIAREFFFGDELGAIEAAPPTLQRDAFFRHWVAKEAVLKAHGAGLTLALDSFCVTFESDGSIARVRAHDPGTLDRGLLVRMLPMEEGWQGAVAASGEGWTLRFGA